MKSILFSGVHGVGKGFFLEKIKKEIEEYNIYSASTLIEKYQPSTDAGYKKVRNVKNNQDILIKAMKEAKLKDENSFILDGHLCIFDTEGNVVRIPEKFFYETQIEGIVLLQDCPDLILGRINARDGKEIRIESIEKMQHEEQKFAEELWEKYKIPYVIITHECTGVEFMKRIQEIGGDNIE